MQSHRRLSLDGVLFDILFIVHLSLKRFRPPLAQGGHQLYSAGVVKNSMDWIEIGNASVAHDCGKQPMCWGQRLDGCVRS